MAWGCLVPALLLRAASLGTACPATPLGGGYDERGHTSAINLCRFALHESTGLCDALYFWTQIPINVEQSNSIKLESSVV